MKKASQIYCIILFSILGLFGCAAMNQGYGTFVPDHLVQKGFESFQMDPNMNYYYSGSYAYPSVIMGLKKQYALDNDLWKPLQPDPILLKDLIGGMQTKAIQTGQAQHGFILRSPDGQTLGVCYCPLDVWIRAKMGEANKVVVYTPDRYPYGDGGDGNGGGRGRRGR
jgi:hypothetical protein